MAENKAGTEKISLKEKFLNIKTLVGFLFAFIIIFILIKQVNFKETGEILKQTRWSLYLLAIAVNYLAYPFRGLRWQKLLKNAGFKEKWRNLTEILFISWFANCIVPAKLGDLYRGYLLKKNYAVSMSKAVGTIFVERISDIFIMFILLASSGLIIFKGKIPPKLYPILVSSAILFILLFAVLVLMKKAGYKIIRIFPHKIQDAYTRFEEGALKSVKGIPLILLLSLVIWLCEGTRVFLIIKALNIELSILLAIFIAMAAAVLTAFPFTPAGLGAVEAGVAGILIFFHYSKNSAVAIALLDRLASYWLLVLAGFILYMISKKVR